MVHCAFYKGSVVGAKIKLNFGTTLRYPLRHLNQSILCEQNNHVNRNILANKAIFYMVSLGKL